MQLAEITAILCSHCWHEAAAGMLFGNFFPNPADRVPVQLSCANPLLDFEIQTRLNQRINQPDIAEVKAVVIRTSIMATGR